MSSDRWSSSNRLGQALGSVLTRQDNICGVPADLFKGQFWKNENLILLLESVFQCMHKQYFSHVVEFYHSLNWFVNWKNIQKIITSHVLFKKNINFATNFGKIENTWYFLLPNHLRDFVNIFVCHSLLHAWGYQIFFHQYQILNLIPFLQSSYKFWKKD